MAVTPSAPLSPSVAKRRLPPQLSRGERSSRHRKRGDSRVRGAVAVRKLDSSSSESTSPEYKHHAATAVVGDDSLSTTMKDSEMDSRSPAPCDLCKSVVCGYSELLDTSCPSTPVSPIAGEAVA
ncbi:hypothetical protein MRX96_036184 [Rhipicephalus microplus]